eukprot:5156137-Pleurochrysis_carterae.AAC.2
MVGLAQHACKDRMSAISSAKTLSLSARSSSPDVDMARCALVYKQVDHDRQEAPTREASAALAWLRCLLSPAQRPAKRAPAATEA